jgi:hypothetical protein
MTYKAPEGGGREAITESRKLGKLNYPTYKLFIQGLHFDPIALASYSLATLDRSEIVQVSL